MNRSTHRLRTIPALQAAVCIAVAGLGLAACDGLFAGTSVGTGNPTEIQVAFRDSSGTPVSVTGTLQVYASTQIPVPGFSPEPLLTVDVAGASSASLKAEAFQALADSLWPKGSVESGARNFNLLLIGRQEGFVLSGFGFKIAEKGFSLPPTDGKANGDKAEITGVVAPLDTLKGSVDTTGFNTKWDYHLFVYGTGFASKIEQGRYSFAGVPRGSYQSRVILLPGAYWAESPPDSAYVFDMKGAIGTLADPLALGSFRETVPLPDTLFP